MGMYKENSFGMLSTPGRRKRGRPKWTWLQGVNEMMREKRLIEGTQL